MDIRELYKKINQSMDDLDLVSARKYMEENLDLLNKNKLHLRSNARELLKFIVDNADAETEPLNRRDMITIYSINTFASKFDIRGLRFTIKNNMDLLMREDVKHYLNADAKALLKGMSAIQIED
ncbi:hypothetical protein [Sporosarcina limicola]|uniref:Uncharacterized protein n=1 Tax=Sporosarcina limicola TaxID=34101 RepID=A0A927RE84_9BACL|nr:hypothetical protein [Sporosarcina limicola]MBE1556080.1 hypothetical protein [Sporosarcina limicola]